jgi:integrase
MSAYQETDPKTGKVFWRVDVTFTFADGTVKRVKRVSPIQTRKGAEAFERDVRNALASGTWGKRREADAITLSAFKERYFKDHVATLKPSTRAGHEAIWTQHLLPTLGRTRLDQVTEDALARLVTAVRYSGCGPKTSNNILSCLRKALETAADWGIIKRSDVPRFKWAKVEAQKFDFFTFEEAPTVEAAAADEAAPWCAAVPFALHTGLRLGELRALRWGDIDAAAKRVTVHRSVWKDAETGTKSGKVRHVPLNAVALAALGKLKRREVDAYVFADHGNRLTREQCKWPLWRICDRAGIGRRVGWHVCRHSFASHLVMRGVPIRTVQELMGHASIEQTMKYSHLAPGHLRGAVETLERPDGAQ